MLNLLTNYLEKSNSISHVSIQCLFPLKGLYIYIWYGPKYGPKMAPWNEHIFLQYVVVNICSWQLQIVLSPLLTFYMTVRRYNSKYKLEVLWSSSLIIYMYSLLRKYNNSIISISESNGCIVFLMVTLNLHRWPKLKVRKK